MTTLPRLPTERLLLRAFVAADAPAVQRLAGAWEVADTTLNIPHPYPDGAAGSWIAEHGPAWDAGRRLTLAIALAHAPDDPIGAMSLALSAPHASAELGYWMGVEWWGRGFATEAARAVVRYGFDTLGLNRVQARHLVRNPASGRVLQKLGMRLEGVQRQLYRRWDRFEDVAMYALLASDPPAPDVRAAAEPLADEVVELRLLRVLQPGDEHARPPAARFLARAPEHRFAIHTRGDGVRVGRIHVRITDDAAILRAVGHGGYEVDAEHRGHGYAARALRLVRRVARAHGVAPLWVLIEPDNVASRRTAERAGLRLVDVVPTAPEALALGLGPQVCRYVVDEP